ncbi:hypothetical protein SAMN05445871_5578 [Paraburkholderia caballeronis]|uniref:Uncharacterized protein n=1 Tax=Paraburkholderia caballeronis TaxID=416943 RepID=A0A1H7WD37_9BURK|nr:hypothetical protein C7403_1322 [Paraburkholderia caballeronis]PXW92380.1 hypothetical protein C7407_1342 [Paraburkholderia caballeronis]RAJ86584.1 hypothetical protein C7409_1342 [Paraburkholderia caballeronis]SEE63839.1 hypothetical protein SAMN05445871_5578 [Paraburkholderia caballeronis]SEM18918.1 hypothetical protein SAMN05192542_13612 [Paraburkholderia caballeronis]
MSPVYCRTAIPRVASNAILSVSVATVLGASASQSVEARTASSELGAHCGGNTGRRRGLRDPVLHKRATRFCGHIVIDRSNQPRKPRSPAFGSDRQSIGRIADHSPSPGRARLPKPAWASAKSAVERCVTMAPGRLPSECSCHRLPLPASGLSCPASKQAQCRRFWLPPASGSPKPAPLESTTCTRRHPASRLKSATLAFRPSAYKQISAAGIGPSFIRPLSVTDSFAAELLLLLPPTAASDDMAAPRALTNSWHFAHTSIFKSIAFYTGVCCRHHDHRPSQTWQSRLKRKANEILRLR